MSLSDGTPETDSLLSVWPQPSRNFARFTYQPFTPVGVLGGATGVQPPSLSSYLLDWQPTFNQPGRPLLASRQTAAWQWFTTWLNNPDYTQPYFMGWQPTYTQPGRPLLAPGETSAWMSHVGPIPDPTSSSVDRTVPTWVQPVRSIVRANSGSFTGPPLQSILIGPDKWRPIFVQPSRTLKSALGTIFTTGQFNGLETTVDRWTPIFVQPGRSVVRARGDTTVRPSTQPDVSFLEPQPVLVQPGRPFRVIQSGFATSLLFPPTTVDQWTPIFVQPGRPVVRATGTDFVRDVSRFPETVTVDRWQPTLVQPGRPMRAAQGGFATSLLFPPTTYPDRWGPTFVQPGRPVVRASGDTTVRSPTQSDVPFLGPQPILVYPGRPVIRAKGTDLATAVWWFSEAVTVDRWQPAMVQPSRLIMRHLGTVVALDSGGFYQPGDPDPYRGTGVPTGPDPHRGTSTRTIVVHT